MTRREPSRKGAEFISLRTAFGMRAMLVDMLRKSSRYLRFWLSATARPDSKRAADSRLGGAGLVEELLGRLDEQRSDLTDGWLGLDTDRAEEGVGTGTKVDVDEAGEIKA